LIYDPGDLLPGSVIACNLNEVPTGSVAVFHHEEGRFSSMGDKAPKDIKKKKKNADAKKTSSAKPAASPPKTDKK